jgi:hypothetical protein
MTPVFLTVRRTVINLLGNPFKELVMEERVFHEQAQQNAEMFDDDSTA